MDVTTVEADWSKLRPSKEEEALRTCVYTCLSLCLSPALVLSLTLLLFPLYYRHSTEAGHGQEETHRH